MISGMYWSGAITASRNAGITISVARNATQLTCALPGSGGTGCAGAPAGSGNSTCASAVPSTASSMPLASASTTDSAKVKSLVPAAAIMVRPTTIKFASRPLPPFSA
ncbi:hypothetical protein D3C76_1027890 [compost metagenome]